MLQSQKNTPLWSLPICVGQADDVVEVEVGEPSIHVLTVVLLLV